MTQTDLAVLGDRSVDAEGLKALTNGAGSVSGVLNALLQRNGCTHAVGPAGVFKADRLDSLDNLIGIKARFLTDSAALLDILIPY